MSLNNGQIIEIEFYNDEIIELIINHYKGEKKTEVEHIFIREYEKGLFICDHFEGSLTIEDDGTNLWSLIKKFFEGFLS